MVYCFFSAQYLPTAGGVERYTFNLARLLCQGGDSVVVVTTQLENQLLDETDENGIHIIRVPSFLFMDGRFPVMKPAYKKQLTAALNALKIDRIIVQTRLYTLCLFGISYAVKNALPYIVIEHGSGYVGASNKLVAAGEKMYENLLIKKAKSYNPRFYAVSKASGAWLKTLGIKCCGVLYNSVDEKALEAAAKNSARNYRKELGIKDGESIVCYVGRMIPEKGILQLVSAVKKLRETQNLCLIAAGGGELYSRLAAENKEGGGIYFIGGINHSDVAALLSQSDIFCLPSDAEGFPTTVAEAVICGCYVITSPYGGAKELILNGACGTVMPGNTEADIINSISDALTHKERCKAAVSAARKRFDEGFTWQSTLTALKAAFAKENQ